MPYIKPELRHMPESAADFETVGQLNYHVTMMWLCYLDAHGLSYQTINDIIGALAASSAEFQRRVAAPYEDQKIEENGDILWPITELS